MSEGITIPLANCLQFHKITKIKISYLLLRHGVSDIVKKIMNTNYLVGQSVVVLLVEVVVEAAVPAEVVPRALRWRARPCSQRQMW